MREITMIAWINALTDIPDWHRKIFDPDFSFEWKSAKVLTGYDVTRSMCIDEVAYYVQDWIRTRIIPAIDGGILKSDECVYPSTKTGLQCAIASLRSQCYSQESPVHDLVDPFLFPYTWEKTQTLRRGSVSRTECISRCGDGDVVRMPPEADCRQDEFSKYRNDIAYSRRYQWLPFDVTFQDDGRGRSRIDGYINNVHPIRHSTLYGQIEILIDQLLPLFNRTLIDLKAPGYQNQRIHLVRFGRHPFIKREPPAFRPPEQRSYEEWLDREGRYKSSIFVDLKREFWNCGVQMVLQIREINLTPDHPKYDGEEWHVQGQTNERICATASYIYSTSNVSSSSNAPPTLSFRRKIFPEEAIAAKGEITTPPFLPQIYGAKHGDPIIQKLGSVILQDNRVVVWPNVFQTKLDPFELDDQSRQGHLRMLTLHLIDPNRRIMSTAMVPCQRRDWWAEAVRCCWPKLYRLPLEIFARVIELMDDEDAYPISMKEGERMREEFVEEREMFRRKHTEAMEGYEEWDFYGEPGFRDGDEE
ncbi:MAG: hypothetical protein Q9202_004754 [Teloschistes flavicans]